MMTFASKILGVCNQVIFNKMVNCKQISAVRMCES